MKATSTILGIMLLATVATGCRTTHQQNTVANDKEYTPPTSIYNILDSTALVYSDPAAGSAVNDHPLRWLGFFSNPIGHASTMGSIARLLLASGFAYLSAIPPKTIW